jgi:hypothetical protein
MVHTSALADCYSEEEEGAAFLCHYYLLRT